MILANTAALNCSSPHFLSALTAEEGAEKEEVEEQVVNDTGEVEVVKGVEEVAFPKVAEAVEEILGVKEDKEDLLAQKNETRYQKI